MVDKIPKEDKWMRRSENRKSKSTYQNRKSAVAKFKQWIDAEEPDYDILEFTNFEMSDFLDWMIFEDGLSELSAYQYFVDMQMYYDFLPDRDVDVNPCESVDTDFIDFKTTEHDKPVFDSDEINSLIDSADSMRGKALISVMASTGLRLAEAVSIKMDQLDLDDRIIHNVETKKRDNHTRTVFFDRKTRRILRSYIKQGYRGKHPTESEYLFVSDGVRNEHISTDRGRVEFIRAVKDCDEIQDKVNYQEMSDGRMRCSVGTHILRRSFCQAWVDEDVGKTGDIMSLKNIAGWKKLETAKNYLEDDVTREERDDYGLKI